MATPVVARAVSGIWIRHAPHDAELLGRANPPADGRWQSGAIVSALYLADSAQTATAEWYRSLAERGFSPQDYVPFEHHRWRLKLELADLSTRERLEAVGLGEPRPSRRTWAAFQPVGEQLWREGWAGLVAPSAARPGSLVMCVFIAGAWPPPGCVPLNAMTIDIVPPPPTGMTT